MKKSISFYTFILIVTNNMPCIIRKYTRKLLLPISFRNMTHEQSLYVRNKMKFINNSKKEVLLCGYKNYCQILKQHNNKPIKYKDFYDYFKHSSRLDELLKIWQESGYVHYKKPVICLVDRNSERNINNVDFKITGNMPRRQFVTRAYDRKIIYNNPLDILKQLNNARENGIPILEFEGVKVKTSSLRYRTFVQNLACVKCGITGTFMALEKTKGQNCKTWHFNLYGYDEKGNEVMLTKDHILPKAKGGKDELQNMQTMCLCCNGLKGDKIE